MLRAHERIKVNCSKWRSREDDDETNCFLPSGGAAEPASRYSRKPTEECFFPRSTGIRDDSVRMMTIGRKIMIVKGKGIGFWKTHPCRSKNDEKWEESVRIRELGLLISVVPTILANKNKARNERKGEGTRKCPVIEQLWQSLYRIKTKMKKMWEKRRNSERGLFIYRFDDPYK